jgi:hypothetical protein
MSAVRPCPCSSTAITVRVRDRASSHPAQFVVIAMNEPCSSTSGTPVLLPWISQYI